MNTQIQLIKIGGSIITDKSKPYKPNCAIIHAIARKIKMIDSPLIVAHGSGSFAHTSASLYGGVHGYSSKLGFAKVARDAMEINRIVMDIFIEEQLPVVSLRPLSLMTSKNGRLKESFFEPVLMALEQSFIPVVYGDVIFDEKWKSTIFSGEATLNYLCLYLLKNKYRVKNIIQLSNIEGIYDKNNQVIPQINHVNWADVRKNISGNGKADVTGGIVHKIENAIEIAKTGIRTIIINGNNAENLISAINKEKIGTMISY